MSRPAVVIAFALPLLLVVAVAAIAVVARVRGLNTASGPATGPLAVATVEAPDAGSPSCAALLASLDGDLPADNATLPRRALAAPAPAGVRAWAADPEPVVLRCGLPRPQELTPTSELLEVNGVRWLALTDAPADGGAGPQLVSYIAVDRAVYVALTEPSGLGSGPLQAVSDVLRATVAAAPVAVR